MWYWSPQHLWGEGGGCSSSSGNREGFSNLQETWVWTVRVYICNSTTSDDIDALAAQTQAVSAVALQTAVAPYACTCSTLCLQQQQAGPTAAADPSS